MQGHEVQSDKFFFRDARDGCWAQQQPPPPRRPTGGSPRPVGWRWPTCPQDFVHSYPQIPVDNYKPMPNVSINL